MKRVLSLSGGGSSGYMTASYLNLIQKNTEIKWDLICGVSTGAIIGGAISIEKNIKDVKNFYIESSKAFKRPNLAKRLFRSMFYSVYDINVLNGLIDDLYESSTLADCKIPFMTHALSYTKPYVKPEFFKSWEAYSSHTESPTPLSSAVTRSSAAPIAFKPFENFYDGGLVLNNPCMAGYVEAKERWPDEEIRVLSIATDRNPGYEPNTFGFFKLYNKIPALCIDGGEEAQSHIAKKLLPKLNDTFLEIECNEYFELDSDDFRAMEAVVANNFPTYLSKLLKF